MLSPMLFFVELILLLCARQLKRQPHIRLRQPRQRIPE
jgi:hypothetical protein